MTKSDKNKSISNKNRPKKDRTKKKKGAAKRPQRVDAVVFDPEARRQYLTGFSQRKQERRAFGLAMQKVKDRTARLEQRAELRSVTREQIAEAEERRRQRMEEEAKNKRMSPARQAATQQSQPRLPKDDLIGNNKKAKNEPDQNRDATNDTDKDSAETLVQTYEGEETQQQWGGLVVVTTSTNIPCSDDDDEEEEQESILLRKQQQQQKKHLDAQQAYAGNVEKYLKDLKGNMPSKKNKAVKSHRGGKHGASNMKGVGSAADLKVAQKMLARTSTASKAKGGAKSSVGGKRRGTKR